MNVSPVRPSQRWLLRNAAAGDLLENFLVAAVCAVLGIRIYLELTGYPQVGGSGLHIAHMLWGGVMMVGAMVLLLGFHGRRIQHAAAVLGGLGFGTFIDELGKFITSDNNYFFQPTIALIYVIFVALFLIFRAIERRRRLSEFESLVNALDLLKELAINDLDEAEKAKVVSLLHDSRSDHPLVAALLPALEPLHAPPPSRPHIVARIGGASRSCYLGLVRSRVVGWAIVGLFAGRAVAAVVQLIVTIVIDPAFRFDDAALSFPDWGSLITTMVANGMIVIGVVRLRRSRLAGYRWFKRSTIVSLCLVQFFSFYTEQLTALTGLMIDVTLLLALDYMIHVEDQAVDRSPEPAAALLTQPARAGGQA
jgi:hypothetical protein